MRPVLQGQVLPSPSLASGMIFAMAAFASGCAALIYEIVWSQSLSLVIGSSAISLGVLLVAFMGGMCAGSFLAPRFLASRDPLRVYGILELVIGLTGIGLLWAMPFVNTVYQWVGGGHMAVRITVAFGCLLIPTCAMGATIPVLAELRVRLGGGAHWAGILYSCNLGGAIAGSLLSGFYLMRVFDATAATLTAATINLLLGIAATMASRTTSELRREHQPDPGNHIPGDRIVYWIAALSGMTALSAELLWTRILSLSLGATVYSFSLILAAFLMGLGSGSALGATFAGTTPKDARIRLAWAQALLSVAIVWGSYRLTDVMPFASTAGTLGRTEWMVFRANLLQALAVVFPAAVLWGGTIPLALKSVAIGKQNAVRVAGRILAANTAGAIAGSILTSLLLAMSIGSQRVHQLLIVLASLAAILALVPSGRLAHAGVAKPRFAWMECTAIVAITVLLAMDISPVPGVLIAYGRNSAEWLATSKVADAGHIVYSREGLNDFVAVSRSADGELNFHASGKVQASTSEQDLRLQLLLAHLSHLVPQHPANTLVIGCGAGITAGALAVAPDVERVAIAEIEPVVVDAASRFFGDYNYHVLQSPKVSVHLDDGRHFLATTRDKFDVITIDLVDPWVKGVAALFTREFFELAKEHLRKGGVITQFVQLYESNDAAVKSEIATFARVFPNSVIWGNPKGADGYDLVLLGQVEPLRIEIDELQRKMASPPYANVMASLRRVGIASATDLLAKYAVSTEDLKPWLRSAEINEDRNLRLQYLAGVGMDDGAGEATYRRMLSYSVFPMKNFAGSAPSLLEVEQAIKHRAPP